MGSKAGPSPLVPTLIVGVLGLIIGGPTLVSVAEILVVLLEGGVATFSFLILLSLVLLLLLYVLTAFFPTSQMAIMSSSSSTHQQTGTGSIDSGGFGLGSVLLVVLFFVLYNVM